MNRFGTAGSAGVEAESIPPACSADRRSQKICAASWRSPPPLCFVIHFYCWFACGWFRFICLRLPAPHQIIPETPQVDAAGEQDRRQEDEQGIFQQFLANDDLPGS